MRSTVAIVTVALFAVASLFFGLILAVAGNVSAFTYALLFAVIMSLVVALGIAMRVHRRNLADAVATVSLGGSAATEIRYSGRQFGLLVSLMTACAVTCAIAATELVIRHDHGLPGAAALLIVCGLFCATFPASAALRHVRRGHLTLSSQAVIQQGWSFESRLAWSEIAGLKAAFNGHPVILLIGYANAEWKPRYRTPLWRIDRLPPVPMIEVDCRKFDVDCHALLAYLAAYAEQPGLRDELGTVAAVARAGHTPPAP